jgi:hypothetical protein
MRDGICNNEPWMDDMRKSQLLGIDFDISVRHVFGPKSSKKCDINFTTDDGADGRGGDMQSSVAHHQIGANDLLVPSLPPYHYPGENQFFYGYPHN